MAILHGGWLPQSQQLFIWGETWRSAEPAPVDDISTVPDHLFATTPDELIAFLQAEQEQASDDMPAPFRLPLNDVQLGLAASGKTSATKTKTRKSAALNTDAKQTRWRSQLLSLPTQVTDSTLMPCLSGQVQSDAEVDQKTAIALYPWRVQGLWLEPTEAVQFLNSLPLGLITEEDSTIGADLRFWSHLLRWGLDLMARSKYLPAIAVEAKQKAIPEAHWQVLLDSALDQARLEQFSRQMPSVCRLYDGHPELNGNEKKGASSDAIAQTPMPTNPRQLILSFLSAVVDVQVRAIAQSQTIPATQLSRELPVREWIQALGTSPVVEADVEQVERLQGALSTWTAPLQNRLRDGIANFRTCFQLKSPPQGKLDWTLEYGLQAADDESIFVDADTIWQNPVANLNYENRTVYNPQETLLGGLGLAARLYPVLEPTLEEQQPQSCTLDPVQAYDFLKSIAWRLRDSGFGVLLPPSLQEKGGWASRLGLNITAKASRSRKQQRMGLQSLLNYEWQLSIGGQTISKEEFDRLVALNTPLVEINGEWVELRPQDIKAAQNFFETRKNKLSLSVEDALRISTGETPMLEKLPVINFEASGSLKNLISTLTTGNQTLEEISEPAGFHGELRPYQAKGVSWLAFLEQWGLGACLADDMGLGKTIQLIAFLLHLREQDALEAPILLVCPTSVLGNWEREVKRFAPDLKTLVHHGSDRAKSPGFKKAATGVNLVITSYALVFRDAKVLKSVSWQGIVLDEAQNIKNPDAKQSRAVRELEAQFKIALTGTPVENRLSELWSIMDFLNPGYLGPRNFFQKRFAVPIERYGDGDSLQTLRSLVQPFILRRLKTDKNIIQDLPEKQEMTVFCGLSAEQAVLYQKLVDESLAQIDDAEGVQRRGMILALLTKLKQVCNHPAQFLDENKLGDSPQRSGKLLRLVEMLEEVVSEGDRALIFTQFAEWGKLLQAYLEQHMGQETLFLYGSTSKQKREEMVNRFQHDPRAPKVFILSLKAGGVGLNLTRANHVFHFDRWWNPAVENQATDRVFRIGQTRNVQVHKFVCTGTLEERIHELIESKKALSEQVVGTGEQWLTELDANQLRDLLLLDRDAIIDEDSD